MVVNFEFIGEEPIENIITCMNFKIDKVVFWGYHDVIEAQKTKTEMFLKKYCEVKTVVFHALPRYDLNSSLRTMRKEIAYEKSQNNKIYFDVTGGEDLILVAFGMLSKEFETPMHMFDIEEDKLIELNEESNLCISMSVQKRKIPMSLELMVKMHGGKINRNLQKANKDTRNSEFIEDAEKIYQIAKNHWDCWNPFSNLLRNTMIPVNDLQVRMGAQTVIDALSSSKTSLRSIRKLNEIIDALEDAGVLLDVVHANGQYQFRYKNQAIKDCLWEGGSVLELHICHEEEKNSAECMVGVHLDWDGVIHNQPGTDVLNEIDVLSLNGNIPTFISCKSGRMEAHQTLYALYELDTVAKRFGGKYAKKALVSAKALGEVYMERAAEMNIEVR